MNVQTSKPSRDLINGGFATLEHKVQFGRRILFPPAKRSDNAANYQAGLEQSLKLQPMMFRRQNGELTHMANLKNGLAGI